MELKQNPEFLTWLIDSPWSSPCLPLGPPVWPQSPLVHDALGNLDLLLEQSRLISISGPLHLFRVFCLEIVLPHLHMAPSYHSGLN